MVDEQKLQELLKQFPLDWNIRFRLLDLLQSRGAHREVIHFVDGATRPPADLASLQKLLDLCVWAQDPAVAWRHLDDFLRDHPESSRTHYLMSKLLIRLDNLALARRHYQKAVALEPQLQSDAMEDKLAGRTLATEPTPAEAEMAAATSSPIPATRPRPLSPPMKPAVSMQRPPLVPLIDAKTEPVKLPPPKFGGGDYPTAEPQHAPVQAPQPQYEEAPAGPPVYPSYDQQPAQEEYQYQWQAPAHPPLQPTIPPQDQDVYPGSPPPPPMEPGPVQNPAYEAEYDPIYGEEEPYQEQAATTYEEEEAPAAEREPQPQQLGTAAPSRPPVVQTGWNFLGTQSQQPRKLKKVREPEVTTYKRHDRRRRKSAAVQLTMLALLVVLGHASFLIAPLYLVSEIPEKAVEIVTSIVP